MKKNLGKDEIILKKQNKIAALKAENKTGTADLFVKSSPIPPPPKKRRKRKTNPPVLL